MTLSTQTTGTVNLEDLSSFGTIPGDCSTWEREAALSIPALDYKSCTYQDYKTRDCAQRLVVSFSNRPEDASGFISEGMSYEEFISSNYERHVLSLGMLK